MRNKGLFWSRPGRVTGARIETFAGGWLAASLVVAPVARPGRGLKHIDSQGQLLGQRVAPVARPGRGLKLFPASVQTRSR